MTARTSIMSDKARRVLVVAALLAVAVAGGAFAQNGKRKSPGSDICVAKTMADYEDANFNTIQAAVNAAKPGQVIEILDVGAYNEQVTIDGREDAPWGNTVVGGKNGITIRYIPVAGNTSRPTITYNDRTNVSPKTCQEAKQSGDVVGTSGNFETNGAVRIIRASGVIIEGLIIDGGGKYTFGYNSVWDETATCANRGGCDGNACPLFHGNAAVAIAVSGNVEIRDCELRNAHFGIAVKDRNTGGVFGNPNPADNDFTIPLSGFGKTGNHLFEYNKIGNNDIGLFFESSWDLGSTIRYNLIYSNYMASIPTGPGSDADKASGAIGFKDSFLSPIAIYNNTFYDNNMNFIGFWQVGFQHLIFNNIFSKPHAYGQPGTVSYMCIDHMFPQRMKHCLLSADGAAPSGPPYYSVQFNKFTQPQQGGGNNGIQPGVVITGSQDGGNFPNGANNRWLETAGLFKSTSPASADFLAPDWTNSSVTSFIRNQGWPDAGILNEDGTVADLGAVPYSGKKPFSNPLEQKSRIRVSPFSVVRVSGQTASTVFYVNEEIGKLTGLTVKYIRWISPIPDNKDSFGNDKQKSTVVPSGSIGTPTTTGTIVPGNNRIEFRLPAAVSSNTQYGFFEVVLQGKDANGNTVTTDVGFLPYRVLEYTLKIEVLKGSTVVTQVQAGDLVTLRVTPYKGTTVYTTTKLNEVEFTLLPDLTTHIWESDTKEFITVKDLGPGAATYPNVFFKSAGDIVISAAGLYQDNPTRPTISLSFLGEAPLLVTPGPAAKVTFLSPLPKSQGAPATINRGVPYEVRVQVQDKYDNAVNTAAQVTLKSEDTDKGNVGAANAITGIDKNSPPVTATCDIQTGIVTFSAHVTNGVRPEEFDLTATLQTNNATDVGRLKIGRASDGLRVFYADAGAANNTKVDPDLVIEEDAGKWVKVTVKVVGNDTVVTSRNQYISVEATDPGLILSATEGGAAATSFQLNSGIATFYVSANTDVFGACVNVTAMRNDDRTIVDGSVSAAGRCEITFKKATGSILRAAVYGDGHGRPDSLLIYYGATSGGSFTGASPLALPEKVTLEWPMLKSAGGVEITAPKSNITPRGDLILHVNIASVRGANVPTGYTSFTNDGRGLVKVYGGAGNDADAVEEFFDVLDAIGPVLANNADAGKNPRIIENLNPGTAADTLIIKLSEQPKDVSGAALIGGNTLLYTREENPTNEPGANGGEQLNVLDAVLDDPAIFAYKVTVAPIPGGLKNGNWIRLNSAGPLVDRGGRTGTNPDYTHPDNKARADNRWVQLVVTEVAPTIVDAYYTSDPVTGKVDFAYVTFDKNVDINGWFAGAGGYVKIGTNKSDSTGVTLTNVGTLLSVSPDNSKVLVVDLDKAYASSQSAIRTSGDMPVAFGFVTQDGEKWPDAKSTAKDRAAPVLADTVYLRLGSLLDALTNEKTPDTLIVVYSEQLDAASLTLKQPVTILTDGGQSECKPTLTELSHANDKGTFYKVTYLVESMNCNIPKSGESVRINSAAGVGDFVTPPNPQTAPDNMKWPIKVIPGKVNWKIVVKSNPFRSDPSGTRGVTVALRPGVSDEASDVEADAKVLVFDNLGNVVVDTTVGTVTEMGETGEYKVINWRWNGYNKKGRLVGTGTYLFKALCEVRTKVGTGSDATVDRQRYSVTKSLGVVRQ